MKVGAIVAGAVVGEFLGSSRGLIGIWKQSGKTIVFVTHGIAEAVFLSTRVIVLTAGPARMANNMIIELPELRTLDIKTSEAFGGYSRRIYRLLGLG